MPKSTFGRRGWPIQLALTIAPPVAAAPAVACFVLLVGLAGRNFPPIGDVFGFWILVAAIGIAVAWTFGLGWHILAIRVSWRRALSYAWAGAAMGAPLGVVSTLAFLYLGPLSDRPDIATVVPFIAGLILFLPLSCALMIGAMWLAWMMRRPDLDIRPDIAREFD